MRVDDTVRLRMARGAPNNMAYYNVPEVPGGGWICVRVQRTRCIELPHQASLIKCLYALSLCVCVCVCYIRAQKAFAC